MDISGTSLVGMVDVVGPPAVVLSDPKPNPASAEVTFTVTNVTGANAVIGVYDSQSKRVMSLFAGIIGADPRTFRFDTRGLSNGVYHIVANIGPEILVSNQVVLR
ncbi:MAG: hypothetical protein JSS75_12890 [Bacteroidetes bacterium]|nr:hypothetical protein [Bacteroidota bacterium]